ncbi:FG-GAP repeat protein [Novosphingobium sp. MW5]|nr:FG-GAP repeat protein [Novosphingobium sp. MW5]
MKVLHSALNGIAIVAMLAAAPALAGKLAKSSRTVIRIDHSQESPPPAQQGSIANGTESNQGLLLPAVQKVRAVDAQPRKGGVNVAAGDVNGDGRADAAASSTPSPSAKHSAKEPAYGMNQNVPRPQQTSTQGPYQRGITGEAAPKAIPTATLYGRKQGSD